MQSENGILLLFYIFLSHGNERKKMKKGGYGVKRGDAVSCPQAPVILSVSRLRQLQVLFLDNHIGDHLVTLRG